ncbi:hypothetical protein MMC22_003207 [Lobaria immixta]|nr:hypothetical protein [Lobaria immixta]
MRKEQEQFIIPSNLTEEQRQIRQIISCRTYRHRVRQEATGEMNLTTRRKRPAQTRKAKARKAEADIQPLIKAPLGRKPNRMLSSEEQRLWDTWEHKIDEEEERMREEREQHIFPSNLTKEQKRLRKVIGHRASRMKGSGYKRKGVVQMESEEETTKSQRLKQKEL